MRLQPEKLMLRALRGNVSVDQLAQAVERTGLEGDAARSALNNWLSGRDHPRCKAQDVTKLAEAVGAAPREIALFESRVTFSRGSTRKTRLVADLIRGKRAEDADTILRFSDKRAAVNIRKCLNAAMADARQYDADPGSLVVTLSRVNEGPKLKRFHPKDRGRAHPILKETSHIIVGVEERA